MNKPFVYNNPKHRFQIGDRVVCIENPPSRAFIGQKDQIYTVRGYISKEIAKGEKDCQDVWIEGHGVEGYCGCYRLRAYTDWNDNYGLGNPGVANQADPGLFEIGRYYQAVQNYSDDLIKDKWYKCTGWRRDVFHKTGFYQFEVEPRKNEKRLNAYAANCLSLNFGALNISKSSNEVNEKSELDKLVNEANTGIKAIAKLNDAYKDRVSIYEPNTGQIRNLTDSVISTITPERHEYRIKKENKFESFRTEDDHPVVLENNNLYIGCKRFNADNARSALEEMCVKGKPHASDYVSGCIISRKGITWGSYILSWKDADKLLAALKANE